MNNFFKLLFLVFVLNANFCFARRAPQPNAAYNGPWTFATINGKKVKEVTFDFDAYGNQFTLNTKCAAYQMPFTNIGRNLVKVDGNNLKAIKACKKYTSKTINNWLSSLKSINNFNLYKDTLQLKKDKKVIANMYRSEGISTKNKEATMPEINGNYRVLNYTMNDAVTELGSAKSEVNFLQNNRISAYFGCNRMNAPFTVDKNKISIKHPISTLMACEGEGMKFETDFGNLMPLITSFNKENNHLYLFAGDKMVAMLEMQ